MLKKLHPDDKSLLILGGGDSSIAEAALAEVGALKLNPNLEIKVLGLSELRAIPSAEFDGVICDLTRCQVGLEETLRHIKRVLKTHGWMSAHNLPSLDSRGMLLLKSMLASHFAEVEDDEASIYAHPEQIATRCGIADFDDVMKVVHAVQPHGLRDWTNARPYVKEKLGHAKAVNLILREGTRALGYLMAVPQKEAVLEMWDIDPAMPSRSDTYYIMLISVLGCARKKRSQRKLIDKMKEAVAQRFGCYRLSVHARIDSSLNKLIQRRFEGVVSTVRRLETCDYIEGSFLNAFGDSNTVIANEIKQSRHSRQLDRHASLAMTKDRRSIS